MRKVVMDKEIPFVEKYRPETFEDIVGHDEVIKRCRSYVANKAMPNICFAGSQGVGKTATAVVLGKTLYGEYFESNFSIKNASDERGIDFIRKELKNIANSKPQGGFDFKIVFLDEVDGLTNDAQAALRATMENYADNCIFILSCNYLHKLLPPILSRVAVFKFTPLANEFVRQKIYQVCESEGLNITERGMKTLLYVANGDLRKGLNALNAVAVESKDIDAEDIQTVSGKLMPFELASIIKFLDKGELSLAKNELENQIYRNGYTGHDFLEAMYEFFTDLIDVYPRKFVINVFTEMGFVDANIETGTEGIQIMYLLAKIAQFSLDNNDIPEEQKVFIEKQIDEYVESGGKR